MKDRINPFDTAPTHYVDAGGYSPCGAVAPGSWAKRTWTTEDVTCDKCRRALRAHEAAVFRFMGWFEKRSAV